MANDQLVTWLNDAYSMEHGLIPVLENHAAHVEGDMPHAAARIRQHIEETHRHAERMEECLRELGTTPSKMKSALASLMGNIQGVSTGMFPDEPVKNALIDSATEQFERSCYRAIALMARELGYESIARRCEENMREEEQMARWLDEQLPAVVRRAMSRAADATR